MNATIPNQFTLRLIVVFLTLYVFKTTLFIYWCHICLTFQPIQCDPVKWSVRRQTDIQTDKQTDVCTCAMQYAYIFHLLGTVTDHICTVHSLFYRPKIATNIYYLFQP